MFYSEDGSVLQMSMLLCSPATLIGALIHAFTESSNHAVAAQYIKTCGYCIFLFTTVSKVYAECCNKTSKVWPFCRWKCLVNVTLYN